MMMMLGSKPVLQRHFLSKSLALKSCQKYRFSGVEAKVSDADKHKTEHVHAPMHSKFYENDFHQTSIKELEFIRSPFYDLAKWEHLREGEEATEFLTNMQIKLGMTQFLMSHTMSQFPNKRSVAFTRYADEVRDPAFREKL